MALSTRRRFIQQTAMAVAAVYGSPLASFAEAAQQSQANRHTAGSLDTASVRKLTPQISGQVITPQSPSYDSARLVFNRAFDERPALIVRCSNVADVQRVLEFVQAQPCRLLCVGEATAVPGSVCATVAW